MLNLTCISEKCKSCNNKQDCIYKFDYLNCNSYSQNRIIDIAELDIQMYKSNAINLTIKYVDNTTHVYCLQTKCKMSSKEDSIIFNFKDIITDMKISL